MFSPLKINVYIRRFYLQTALKPLLRIKTGAKWHKITKNKLCKALKTVKSIDFIKNRY